MTGRPALLILPRHLAPLPAFPEGTYDVYRLWEGPAVEGESPLDPGPGHVAGRPRRQGEVDPRARRPPAPDLAGRARARVQGVLVEGDVEHPGLVVLQGLQGVAVGEEVKPHPRPLLNTSMSMTAILAL